jgi:hypothetical protein
MSSFKNPPIKVDLLPRCQNPLSYYLYSIMNLNTISLPWQTRPTKTCSMQNCSFYTMKEIGPRKKAYYNAHLGELTYSTKHYLPSGLWVAPSHGHLLDHRLSEAVASTCRENSDKVHYTRVVVVHTTWPSIKQTMLCFARYAEFEIFLCNPCLPISWKGLFLIKSMQFSCNFRI